MKTNYSRVIIAPYTPHASPSLSEFLVFMFKVAKNDSWTTYSELPENSTYSNAAPSNLPQTSSQKAEKSAAHT